MKTSRRIIRTTMLGLGALWLLATGLAHAGVDTVTYVYTDPQGTPLAEADAHGTITATFDYAPYGSQALGTPPDGPGYTGHVNDPDTGLVYMQARYYDPAVGRFLSVDPVGVGNLFNFNRYDYANNNPIANDDPDGKCTGSLISGADGVCLGGIGSFVAGAGYSDFFYDSRESQSQKTVSKEGRAFIKGWEGWNGVLDKSTGRWKAKDDGFGNGTIGWGHKCGKCAEYSKGITKLQGEDIFKADLRPIEASLNTLVADAANTHHFDSLASFAFNVRNYRSSTLMRNVAFGNPVIEINFTAYSHARKNGVMVSVPSLLKRRESEWKMYSNGIYNSIH